MRAVNNLRAAENLQGVDVTGPGQPIPPLVRHSDQRTEGRGDMWWSFAVDQSGRAEEVAMRQANDPKHAPAHVFRYAPERKQRHAQSEFYEFLNESA